jgi:hypothetical protein
MTLTFMHFIANSVRSSRLLFGMWPRTLADVSSTLTFVIAIALLARFISLNVA